MACSSSSWVLVVHLNLSELYKDGDSLLRDAINLRTQVLSSPVGKSHNDVAWETSWIVSQATNYRDRLVALRQSLARHTRTARSVVPFMGKAYHYMFGVATDDELRHLRARVLEQHSTLVHDGMAQLSLIRDAEDRISNVTYVVKALIGELNATQLRLAGQLNKIGSVLESQQSLTRWTSLQSEAIMALHSSSERLQRLHEAVEAASKGRLSSDLLPPPELRHLLSALKPLLGAPLRLPFDPLTDDLYWYYDVAAVRLHTSPDDLVYTISVPLLDNNFVFDLYRLTPFPIFLDAVDSWITWDGIHRYVAMATPSGTYCILDDGDLDNCSQSVPAICPMLRPLLQHPNSSCEVSLVQGRLEHCSRSIARHQEPVFRLIANNWVYSVADTENSIFDHPAKLRELLDRLPSPASSIAIDRAILQLNKSYVEDEMRNHHWKLFHWTAGSVLAALVAVAVLLLLCQLITRCSKGPVVVFPPTPVAT
ncbi:Hypothetical protein NTJ_02429 [Nesidiocoris tenuis]|uniref:Uncharacterized protein n=1 Tax=Nesidiocoris tenuis TaxID=355587 RepID=A0ABN7ABE0_9HEMI|nr:Hypothetical protein NTJ_02429 [Nesidiocoris tenuis]